MWLLRQQVRHIRRRDEECWCWACTERVTYPVQPKIQSARVAHVLAFRVATPRRRLGDAAVGAAERFGRVVSASAGVTT